MSAAFLIGTEEKVLAGRVVLACFELHFYMSTNGEMSQNNSEQGIQ